MKVKNGYMYTFVLMIITLLVFLPSVSAQSETSLSLLERLPDFALEWAVLIAVIVVSVLTIGRAIVQVIRWHQEGKTPDVILEGVVDSLDTDLRDSIVYEWVDQQVAKGKLSPKLAEAVNLVVSVSRAASTETESTALKKLASLVGDMLDGNPNT